VGHDNGVISAFSVPELKLLSSQLAHDAAIARISNDRASAPIVTSANDGSIAIWRWSKADNKLIRQLSLYALPENAWLSITPEGFFTSSNRAGLMVNVGRGLEVASVEQVYDHLQRGDLVAEQLKGDAWGKYKDAASKLNLETILESQTRVTREAN
jgi:hypothetical protein